ncbi:MAG: helix-turn-helix transcriptional regulator [Dermatophilaceae bacterium]
MTGAPKRGMPNTALRAARLARSLSQDELARALREAGWAGCDRRTVQRYESGAVRRPQFAARRALLAVLGLPWDELGFRGTVEPPGPRPEAPPAAPEGDDDVRRRTFGLSIAAAAIAGPHLLDAESAQRSSSEALRHGLVGSLGADAVTEEWEAIRDEYAIRIVWFPASVVLPALLDDLAHFQSTVAQSDDGERTSLCRIGVHLAGLTAWAFASLDHGQTARWWRLAHHLADRANHPDAQVWVTAQEAIMALYQPTFPLHLTRQWIADASPLANRLPASAATAWFHAVAAQAAGMDSDETGAVLALSRLTRTVDQLPSTVTSARSSFLGWPETRLDYAESFTYAHLGRYEAAAAAQDRALAALPADAVREPVKLELQRALCLATAGDAASAERHAVRHLSRIDPSMTHNLVIANLTSRVVAALPPGRRTDEATYLRDHLQPPSPASRSTP